MSYLFLIAVLGGAASVLTPCVLPLLPAILAVSGAEGRRRALGIALGIEVSFFVLAIALAGAISSLGLPANTLRWVAAVMLAGFGLVLIVPRIDAAFSNAMSRLTSRVPHRRSTGTGFAAGVATGLPLGLVWAPCAGPILAGITLAASSSRLSSRTVVTMSGYALGMAPPLLAVILGGNKLSMRLRRALGGGRRVLAPMGVVLLATAVLIAFGGLDTLNSFIARTINLTSTPTASLERKALSTGATTSSAPAQQARVSKTQLETSGYPELDGLGDLGPAPELVGISRWYNTDAKALSLAGLRGKVVLVDFWTYSCINCIRTLPHVKDLYAKYAKDGFVVVGVHTPEFAFEADPGNVGKAVKDFGITYPVGLDPHNGTWNNYYNQYWPAHYLIDRNGEVRSVHYGEGAYARTENEVRQLLGMKGDVSTSDDRIEALTPETYLGSAKAERFQGGTNGRTQLIEGDALYSPPRDNSGNVRLHDDNWSYAGSWSVSSDRAVAVKDAQIYLRFRARNVYIVAGPGSSGSGKITTLLGGTKGEVAVDGYRLYTVRTGAYTDQVLRLDVSPGVEVYSFTFG